MRALTLSHYKPSVVPCARPWSEVQSMKCRQCVALCAPECQKIKRITFGALNEAYQLLIRLNEAYQLLVCLSEAFQLLIRLNETYQFLIRVKNETCSLLVPLYFLF